LSLCICVYFSAWPRLCFCLMYLSRKRQRISGRAAVLATIYLPQSVRTPPQGKAPWRPRTLTLGALSALEASLPCMQISRPSTQMYTKLGRFGPALLYVLFVNSKLHIFRRRRRPRSHGYNLVYFWPRAQAAEQFLTGQGHHLQIVCSNFADICLWQIICEESWQCLRDAIRY